MKAQANEYFTVFYFDAGGTYADETKLKLDIMLQNDTIVQANIAFTKNVVIPDLFMTAQLQLQNIDSYTLRFKYDGVIALIDTVEVGLYPVSDVPVNKASVLLLSKDAVGDAVSTVKLRIINKVGVAYPLPPTAMLAAPYDADTASYAVSNVILQEGHYALVWHLLVGANYVPLSFSELYVTRLLGKEAVRFTVCYAVSPTAVPIVGATIVLVDSAGDTQAYGTTGSDGQIFLDLSPGTYTAVLVKEGKVFTRNNFTINVLNSYLVGHANQFLLNSPITEYSIPNLAPIATTKLFVQLYDMRGKPLAHADIQVGLLHRPEMFGANAVFDTSQLYKTDSNGYAEFRLVQGIKVEVFIVPTAMRRIITVPVSNDPVNLLTLLSGLDDLFDIQKPNIPAAYKRTL